MKLNSIERNHSEWLTLVEINGPFLSISVLTDHYPNGIDRVTPEAYQDLKEGFAEWEGSQKGSKPNPEMQSIWMEYVLKVLLGFSKEILNKEQILESTKYQHLKMDLGLDKIYPDYLIPDVEYREEIGKAKLAVFVYPSSQDTREKFIGDAKLDSPLSRASQYLKSTGVPFALVTNGSRFTLIHTGKSELTGYASWESKIWVEERIHLDSFYTLLRKERFFGLSPERTLEKLYEKSRNDQQDVTEQISLQVRNAIEIYIQNLDRINVGNEGKLLKDISESKIYEAALTLMMRLLVLFFAEENKFLQSENELYENFYSISRLGEELRKVADQKGEEVLERRYDAYARLIACFRLIFEGSAHPELPVVAYGGSLFDPNRFPFLEGRISTSEQVSILKIDNRTTLHLLEALQFLQTKLPGDTQVVARRMSFKSLDIEDIGHIYESLLEYTAKRADKITLSFQATRSQSVKFTLEEVETVADKELVDFFKTETGRTENFIKRALKGDIDYDKAALDAASQDPKLTARIRRYAALLQKDSYYRPVILQKDAIYIDFGSSRRSTGTHYTPAELTKTVVINLLECLVYEGVREGKPRKDWKLKSPEEILKLKVCDISMGSGAFLVQVCRYLAERLIESWQALEGNAVLTLPYGKPSTGNAEEELLAKDKKEREAQALRLIADRCIYGVDLNPLAVEMAKVSLWLVTMQKDKPFTFLDHALKCGDSLLGLEFSEFKRLTQITDKEGNLAIRFYNSLIVEYIQALDLRTEILEIDDSTPEKVRLKENLHREANAKLTRIKAGCDLFVGGILFGIKEAGLVQLGLDISLGKEEENRYYPQIQEILKRYKPFHWELEFPEVFTVLTPVDSTGNSLPPLQKGEGFDAFAGNPPFMGGQKITGALGVSYRDYLVERLANKQKGSADLSSYFFLRAFRFLSPSGVMGLIATNTIAQGDTREIGLESITSPPVPLSETERGGKIYRAVPSMEWPNAAAVFVSICWIAKGEWKAGATLVKESGEEVQLSAISSYLTKQSRVEGKPFQLKANEGKSFQGSIVLGMGFVLEPEEAEILIKKNPKNKNCLYPYLNGEDLNSRPDQSPSRWVIQFFDWPLNRSASGKWDVTDLEHSYNSLGILLHHTFRKESNEAMVVHFWEVSGMEATRLKEKTGLELNDYSHALDDNAVKDILTKHRDKHSEESRGQEAITQEEIFQIPEILYRPDTIEYAGKNKKNLETIRYTKNINGVLYYFEEVRTGKKELMGTTLYKKKPERENAGKSPLPLTPEASLRQEFNGTMRQRISQAIYGENVTPSSGFTFYKDPPDIDKPLSIERRDWLRAGIVPSDYPYPVAADYPDLLQIVEEKVKPERDKQNREERKRKWWQFAEKTPALYKAIDGMERVIIIPRVSPTNSVDIYKPEIVFHEKIVVLIFTEIEKFSILQSSFHWTWAVDYTSTLGATTLNYSPSDCFETFPFPDLDSPSLRDIGEQYYELRKQIMVANNEGLTKTYNRFHDPKSGNANDVKTRLIASLRDLHIQMDYAVRDAYGWTDLDLEHGFHETKQGVRFTVSDRARVEILDRLLELNHARHALEVEAIQELPLNKKKKPAKVDEAKKKEEIVYPRDLFGEAIASDLFGTEVVEKKRKK
ncbi:MAG: hypothetical protein IPL26_01130 [Leptospiraceae bacterium]|nr:hypothetical protein [Leptospiraceae bacterium]